jgi:hypothetical protein
MLGAKNIGVNSLIKRITDRGFDGGTKHRWETISEWISDNNWKRGVEIGVWKGDTFKYLLNAHKNLNLSGVDLYEPQPDNCGPEKWSKGENGHSWDHKKYYANMLKLCNQLEGRGKIIKDYSTNASEAFDENSLDFVFIDGDHSYQGVISDIEAWYPKIREGGWIIGHDIHFETVKNAVKEKFGDKYGVADDFIWYVVK